MGKILTVSINKGGTGKTTIAAHLAFLAAERGAKTLLVDLDAQGNASDTVTQRRLDPVLIRMASDLFDDADSERPIFHAADRLDLLPSDDSLLSLEKYGLPEAQAFATRLRTVAVDYDLVVVDTPPTMGLGMLAPLLASQYVLSPIIPDAYSMKGVQALAEQVAIIRKSHNPSLIFLGVLVNKWRRNSTQQNRTVEQLRRDFGRIVIPYELPEAAAIADAAHHRRPVWREARWGSQRVASAAVKSALTWVLDNTGTRFHQVAQ
ncbi:MAG TPA: ParA family protein [Polyangia bacterium]|nr:ParA family protein [Polyangia bacterium]